MDEEKSVAIKCPCCGQRLFNLKADTQGVIGIKCPRCKTVMAVKLMKKRISVVPSK